ncbi:type II toxin-antitoxin system HicA family toxin [Haloferula sargassicola]|uniref:type II toxin-antitoxin system HicA family toxin n=1 Tax=Haloferula sargassicola TaxID=490096 RepID=UPI0033656E72
MGPIPILKPREVKRLLDRHGFVLIRQKESHCQYRHNDGRQTTRGATFHRLCSGRSPKTSD